jgi:Zn-finger nucleic acid-binding protein
MNCRNCGAAMVLAPTGTYSYCQHCGTFHFPERQDDGIRVLGDALASHACPDCGRGLSPATLDDRSRVLHCGNCRGALLPRSVFASVLQTRRAWATAAPAAPVALDRRELEREVSCPVCRSRMDTHPYHGPGAIVIDTCSRCDVIWLGTGELQRAVDAPGRDRGSSLRAGEGAKEFGVSPLQSPRTPVPQRIDLLDLLNDLL